MVYNLSYRRPQHVASSRASVISSDRPKSIGESTVGSGSSSKIAAGIPSALAFDRIVNGGTCPPCTTRDFMNYLMYIEHSAENLQFFLWFKDYCKRFDALPTSEQVLSPPWTREQADALEPTTGQQTKQQISAETEEAFKGTDFAAPVSNVTEKKPNPFSTPPRTPGGDHESVVQPEATWEENASTLNMSRVTGGSHRKNAADAFDGADVKWQPFTVQPFREEMTRVISIYIADGGSRQLNLSAKERATLLHALASTTHPSAFHDAVHTVEWSLRHQAHPNFIRWTICNGNRPRVIFARGLGIGGIVAGFVVAILLTLSHAGRGWRVLSALGFLIGISTLFAAWKGMCVVLHGMHHRHLRPWELFASADDDSTLHEVDMGKCSFDSLGSSNSYEDEPWVAKYEKRNLIRKVFDREVWIREPALRQIQDTIFVQSLLTSVLLSAVAVGVFCAFPKGNFF